ncbi:hypothetical protein PC117_g14181 [Phytophthora cactorum]|uniref:Uncharacterized protein n=1 Tax=Phytophthora cactorum TaxID=29920 RepID=A0A8T1CY43_9STRA|nr:hypothetical protein PC117_g14181 [Phytophthora cactorum]
MSRKRKKKEDPDNPDTWDIVADSQELGDFLPDRLRHPRYSVDTKLPKRKKCKGVVLVRNRAEVEFEDKKCHAVLRCDHENYEARYWDRDVNAAINMVELLKSEVLGRGRMEPFRRS